VEDVSVVVHEDGDAVAMVMVTLTCPRRLVESKHHSRHIIVNALEHGYCEG
jgi:hypothetical protein